MGKDRGSSCNTCCKRVWTGVLVMLFVMWGIGALLIHVSVPDLVDAITGLPTNLRDGFYKEFKFDRLGPDSQEVRDDSTAAVASCGANVALDCGSITSDITAYCQANQQRLQQCQMSVDNSDKMNAIIRVFDTSLGIIKKVSSDKYFGIDDLASTANDLTELQGKLDELRELGNNECAGQLPLYCGMYELGLGLAEGTSGVNSAIDKLIDSDEVRRFEDEAEKLVYLHALPYALLVSLFFFVVFWYKDAACLGCGGTVIGALACCCHLIFWLVFFIVSIIFVAIGVGIMYLADNAELTGAGLKGDPTLGELLDHVQTTYPTFWDIVFEPLEYPMLLFWRAFVVFLFFCIVIFFYGCCVCTCRPYKKKEMYEVSDENSASAVVNVGAK
jgi:TM2 domain-containing membrane protein YozV